MESGRRDVGGLERIESEQVINAQETRNALSKQFVRLAKLEDTSPSVMNVERLQFRNVTPTLVVNFDDGQEGQRVEILGDGNTTIQNNAKIITASGVDTLLDVDVTYAFTRYTDGKWHQSAGASGGGGGGGGGGVTSFATRTGAVVPVNSDYPPAFIGAVPTSHLTDPDPHSQYALDSDKGIANGYASLDSGGLVPSSQLPPVSGGRVLIATQILAAAVASISFTAIPATYQHLELVALVRSSAGSDTAESRIQVNGDTGGNYDFTRENRFGVATGGGSTFVELLSIVADANLAGGASSLRFFFPDYKNTNWHKSIHGWTWVRFGGGAGTVIHGGGAWRNTAVINRIDLFPSAGNWKINSEFRLYGLV